MSIKVKVIGLGAGGHAKVVIEILQAVKGLELAGLLDPADELKDQFVLGVPVLGDDKLISALADVGVEKFFIGTGGKSETMTRQRLYELGVSSGLRPIKAVHSGAVLSASADIGEGVSIMATAVINAKARLGVNVVVNTGAIVEHDTIIGDHVFISTGCRLAGGVRVGTGAFIGTGATVMPGVEIGAQSVVGAGAVVVKNVAPDTVVAGVPARPMKA